MRLGTRDLRDPVAVGGLDEDPVVPQMDDDLPPEPSGRLELLDERNRVAELT